MFSKFTGFAFSLVGIKFRTRPEFRFRSGSGTGSGEIWTSTGSGPVPDDLEIPDRYGDCFHAELR